MDTLLNAALHAGKEAGDAIMALYSDTNFTAKHDGTPVTLADTTAHNIVVRHLEKTGIPVLSEEAAGMEIPYPSFLWIIDPIDGTRDFIEKTGDFAVMIGLLHEGRPVLGVVYAPLYSEFYYGVKDNGAYLKKGDTLTKLQVTSEETGTLRFIQSAHHVTDHMKRVAQTLDATCVPHGSIGIKASHLCRGNGEFYFTFGALGEWDVCAPHIILEEAGGMVTDGDGNTLTYGNRENRIQNGIIMTNGACHARVLDAVRTTRER